MNGRSSEDTTASPSSLIAKANGASPSLRPQPLRTQSGRPGKPGKRKVSKGMIKRVEGGGMGLMNPMGWYDAEGGETLEDGESPQLDNPPSPLDLVSSSATEGSAYDEAVEDEEEPPVITDSPTAIEASQ